MLKINSPFLRSIVNIVGGTSIIFDKIENLHFNNDKKFI